MDCDRARKLMPLTVNPGDVQESTRGPVLAHAEACPACRAELEAYRRAAGALATVREVPEPPGGWDGLRDGILSAVAAPKPRAASVWGRRLLRTAATLLIAFTAGFTAYHLGLAPTTPEGPDPEPAMRSGAERAVPAVPAATLSPDLRDRVGLVELLPQPGRGWQIRRIQPGSPAFLSGLRPDDVLRAVDDDVLPPSPEELKAVVQRKLEQPEIRIRILRGGSEKEMVIKLQVKKSPEAPEKKPEPESKP